MLTWSNYHALYASPFSHASNPLANSYCALWGTSCLLGLACIIQALCVLVADGVAPTAGGHRPTLRRLTISSYAHCMAALVTTIGGCGLAVSTILPPSWGLPLLGLTALVAGLNLSILLTTLYANKSGSVQARTICR